jgi:cobalt-zinc-cadmium efflux system membrane fusion protein
MCAGLSIVIGVISASFPLGCGRVETETQTTVSQMCAEHGVPESVCARCNADLTPEFQASGDWCAGHGVPETQCALCHPDLLAAGVVPVGSEEPDPHAGHDHGSDEEHAEQVSPAVGAYPGLSIVYRSNQLKCATDGATITFASAETAQRAGIRTQPVLTGNLHNHFEAPAEVVFDQNATTLVSSSLPVTVVCWLVEAGDRVATGQALAEVESPDMALLQAEYLEAHSDARVHQRERERADGLLARDFDCAQRRTACCSNAWRFWAASSSPVRNWLASAIRARSGSRGTCASAMPRG